MKKIVIDCLGADKRPQEIALGAIHSPAPFSYVLIGPKEELLELLDKEKADKSRYEIIDATTTIENGQNPMALVKGAEETSVVKGLLRAKEDDVLAFISAGNTGAILLGSIFRLGLIEGLKYPALGCPLYNIHGGKVCLLDCGANLDITPELIVRFAKIGEAVMRVSYHIEHPRIALLNVGKEEGKGNAFCKAAYSLLKEQIPNFIGNIEGNDILLDKADVILTDGYSGNIALKAIEATAKICKSIVKKQGNNPLIDSACADIDRMFDYTGLGASIVYGAKKLVLKPHGSADERTITNVIAWVNEEDADALITNLAKGLNA